MRKIIVVTGQTATGKTKRALEIAQREKGLLINFDSRHVYTHLDIVSGKDLDSIRGVEFLLHSFIDPRDTFSSFEYRQHALQLFKQLKYRNRTFVLVGGTYLYLYNLLYGIHTEVEPDWELRNELEHKTVEELQQILQKESSEMYSALNNSDKNNPRRLIRKIEVASGHPGGREATDRISVDAIASLQHDSLKFETSDKFRNAEIVMIGLEFTEKNKLIETITRRVEERIHKGAFEEVEKLLAQGYVQTDPGLRTIGYQQIIKFFTKELSREEAVKEWITKEVQYAKRQLTFMKRDPNIVWESV